jgi:RNA polymerase sigma-70 factor (ECF subfamily)
VGEHDWLARRFEEDRPRLRAVAYRMLGSTGEAEDAVQEAWLRLARSDADEIANLSGWLTTVVSRVCLDALRSRTARREQPIEELPNAHLPEPGAGSGDALGPEHEALVADSVGAALLAILDTLTPAERVALVLHDVFGVPFAEIASVVGRSSNATKMLTSRARRRVRGGGATADPVRKREVVDAFLAAAREGDFEALLGLLDPGVVLRADGAAVETGAPAEVRGAPAVARTFSGRARAARPALVDGAAGAAWAPGGQPRVAFGFEVAGGKIIGIELIADPERLIRLNVTILDG